MKTPITDQYVADNYNVRVFDANHCFDFARRLELDRAVLMEACSLWISERDNPSPCWVIKKQAEDKMRSALASARANFPEQP